MYLQNKGLTSLYILLTQWTYIISLSSKSMGRTINNPCHDHTRFDLPVRQKKDHDIWEDSENFLQGFHHDLKQTANLSSETLAQIERYLGNENHITYLKSLPNIPVITWESFLSSPVTEMLQKIYTSLATLTTFSNSVKESLKSEITQERQHIISMVREVEQGRANRGGLYQMLCDIYRQIRHDITLHESSEVPLDFPDDVSLTRDEDKGYYVLQNMERVLNGISLELKAILDSNRMLRLYRL